MKSKKLIHAVTSSKLPASCGNKALNLQALLKMGVRIPVTYVCDWEAYHRYLAKDPDLLPDLKAEISRIVQAGKKYAVRSSANIEDNLERSFAGQFRSELNVQGVENILQATLSIWSSARAPIVESYLERHDISGSTLNMAVIIQEMIPALYSGVSLSKNPVTGGDEVVVEAVEGEGSQLVQSGVTPARWVNRWGYWVEKADTSSIPLSLVEQIIVKTKEIASRRIHPVDMEWVYDGDKLTWVQMRQITAMNTRNIYSNHIPREMLPGVIKPLIFSVNIPLINSIWISMIGEITGDLGIRAEDLAKLFHYRVYFNMGVLGSIFKGLGLPAESVEMLMGIVPRGAARPSFKPSWKTFTRLPWAIVFFFDKLHFGRKMRRALAELEPLVKAIPYQGLEGWGKADLLKGIDRLEGLMKKVAYYNVVGPLMMMMYNRALGSQLERIGVEANQFDLTENLPGLADFDPATFLTDLNRVFRSLHASIQEHIKELPLEELIKFEEAKEFARFLERFLERFGHLSDSGNDFSVVPWRETPELVIKMAIEYESPVKEVVSKIRMEDLRSRKQLNFRTRFFYHRAREFRLLREQVSGLYTYGYGLFRYYYLELGSIFTQNHLLDKREDIFFLTKQQICEIASAESIPLDPRAVVAMHKGNILRYGHLQLPSIIYGEDPPPIREGSMEALVGVAASIGNYTGRVRVVRGLQDFSKVKAGDVLVIPYSEVSWTPLFARAGAVIAESGGLLSHSAIVAREYNIPAVVSVEGATHLSDDTLVTVDGMKGEVLVHSSTDNGVTG